MATTATVAITVSSVAMSIVPMAVMMPMPVAMPLAVAVLPMPMAVPPIAPFIVFACYVIRHGPARVVWSYGTHPAPRRS